MKTGFFTVLIALSFSGLFAQNFEFKFKTDIYGPVAAFNKTAYTWVQSTDGNTRTTTSIEKLFSDIESQTAFVGDKVNIYNKQTGSKPKCAEGTKEEYATEIKKDLEKRKVNYDNLKVVKTDKQKKILGFNCKNAIITYEQTTMGFKMEAMYEIWYTEEVGFDPNFSGNSEFDDNKLNKAIKELGGFIMKQAVHTNNQLTMEMEVYELHQNSVSEDQIVVDISKCKKVMTMEQFFDEMRKEEQQRALQSRTMYMKTGG